MKNSHFGRDKLKRQNKQHNHKSNKKLSRRNKIFGISEKPSYICIGISENHADFCIGKMENKYLSRKIDSQLLLWSKEEDRKPLLIRGARQVGKSSAVRHLGSQFDYFIEINFEQRADVRVLFEKNMSPQDICENISLLYNTPITPGKTLLFFDEIQASIPAISSLRYFYEKYPELHLVAAGSLLEFALEELPSFGVGRVRSMFVYPFCFEEFLSATSNELLWQAIQKANTEKPLMEPIHNKALSLLKKFLILGGMPEVVSSFVNGKSMLECMMVLDDLIISYKDDFSKYKKRVPSTRISEIFDSVVQNASKQFQYTGAAEANLKQIKEALNLLIMAGLVIPVTHTAANGIPLGAEANPKKRKMLPLDTGLFQRLLGLNISDIILSDDFEAINKGAIAEIFVGLELKKSGSCYWQNELYFWKREEKNSNAEVDYLIQQGENIIPIEVKSGNKGSMRSMHLFLDEKKSKYGIRCSAENFSSINNITIIPLYSAGCIISR